MRILLIMNAGNSNDLKIIVKLDQKCLIRELKSLVLDGLEKEAFELVMTRAEVVSYIPPGRKIAPRPDLTLVEDMI